MACDVITTPIKKLVQFNVVINLIPYQASWCTGHNYTMEPVYDGRCISRSPTPCFKRQTTGEPIYDAVCSVWTL